MNINFNQLHVIMPLASADTINKYLPYINKYAAQFHITTRLRMCHFLAQIAVESGEMRHTTENLSYSTSALLRVFPKHFNATTAAKYAYRPDKIANKVYANRYGNGNPASGDGYRYRGRGFIQITFKNNYKAYNDYLTAGGMDVDLLETPELLSNPVGCVKSAMWVFDTYGCNKLADKDDITAVRKRINGGSNGLEEAKKYLSRAKMVIK